MGIEARIRLGEDRFCELGDKAAHPCLPHLPVLQVNSRSIDQKSGEIWTAQADLQPIHHKSDRLLDVGWAEQLYREAQPTFWF